MEHQWNINGAAAENLKFLGAYTVSSAAIPLQAAQEANPGVLPTVNTKFILR